MNTLLFGSLTYQECVTVAEHYGDLGAAVEGAQVAMWMEAYRPQQLQTHIDFLRARVQRLGAYSAAVFASAWLDLARDGARGYTGNGCPICPDGLAMTAFYLEERWRPDVLVGSDIDYPLRAAA
jgi:hypothetical protein